MTGNTALIPVKDHRWLNGFGNIFRKESFQWWRTWTWVIQSAIWLVIVNGMMAMVILAEPEIKEAQAQQKITAAEAATAREALKQTALTVFFVFCGLAPAAGVVIIAQDALIGERQSGTASWVLSKPVSRSAFLLSKLSSDALGIVVTMVIIQGIAAYWIYYLGTGILLPPVGFTAALGLVALALIFYLTLTYLLGTLFHSRGPVIGFSLILVFGNSITNGLPILGKVMPWNLVMALGPDQPALAVLLAQGEALPTVTPIVSTAVLTLVFIIAALWRINREEF